MSVAAFGGRAATRVWLAMVATVLIVAVGLVHTPRVSADPVITDATEALERLSALSREATRANDEVLTAQIRLEDLQGQLGDAEGRQQKSARLMADARQQIDALQEIVDKFAFANYQGIRFDSLFALLTSDSPQDLITQMSAFEIISRDTLERIKDFESARTTYQGAEQDAREAAAQFRSLTEDARVQHELLASRQSALQAQIEEIKELYETLSAEERQQWAGVTVPPGFDPGSLRGSGTGVDIARAALTRLGAPYVWGATGPDQFDCSGLVMWAHNQSGRAIPRTSQMQAQGGMPVSPRDIQPGDVVIYYRDASHVGLYIGNGQIVHASTFGVPVKVDAVNSAPVHSIRRY
ncbi:NlpC/P60 family protein [Hoyosella altamirensis]|uniref:Cell wall-associated NlpC family hydrolase/heme exporter protein D n=1 Tax=Hoyosella altamirensis TaxID=616997 RepID=A0A839RS14_9ACTN|nr:NlpC/P60 family protein [Hoyosella altamirensis]MBB3038906.1 cell wall-associated NlpC family hydrolase/heme exporter protein D [Hoyosella altamirensis]